jgi:uncharacterized protein (TIGR02246 family)
MRLRHALKTWSILTSLAVVLGGCVRSEEFTAADESAVRAAIDDYVQAWLANDADRVLATLTDDIVLQPHHGVDPVVGAAAAREFWFPNGPPTTITTFSIEIRGVQGAGDLAYVWGRSNLAWEYEGQTYTNAGNSLSVLRRGADGRWKIAHQIWNDPIPQPQL